MVRKSLSTTRSIATLSQLTLWPSPRTAEPMTDRQMVPPGVGDDHVARGQRGKPTAARGQVGDRFFRQLVVGMRNGVLAITRDGALAAVNDAAYRILSVTRRPDDIGAPLARVFRDQPEVVRILAGAFDLNHLPNRAELRLKGSGKVIGYTLSHVLDEQDHAVGAALFFKDLTLVEQLVERERLRDRLATLGEMAAVIAHEVKNPLAGIEVMAGLLRRRLPDSHEAQALLNDIINEAKIANAIVLEVLDFVRPIRLQVEHTSIAQVLHDAVAMAERKVARGEVAVTINVGEKLPLIRGDQHQLCQLFGNLLINALEALAGRGTISIAAREVLQETDSAGTPGAHEPIQTLVVEVTDDGPGVQPDILDRIFNPFFTTKPQGSGLGLAIVRKIVDAHDGHIDVQTAAGSGTRFRVTLPVSSGKEWFG
jgi:two-component system sensor histidine kinase AtoS